ncbi:MAG: hypothetical protein R2789_19075 [Microthrixaceae bacterium]
MKIAFTEGSLLITSSAPVSHLCIGTAADVEEVRGRAAHLIDHIEGAHGESRAAGDDAHRALEAHALQALRGWLCSGTSRPWVAS